MKKNIRLGVNIDHVATLRNARGGIYPEITKAAKTAEIYGADLITVHLREDRRHVNEGGLDVVKNFNLLRKLIDTNLDNQIKVAFFIDPNKDQLCATQDLGVKNIEFHTGAYANAFENNFEIDVELEKIREIVLLANKYNINCHAGHGLNFDNVSLIASIPFIEELNIGHFLIADSIFNGLHNSILKMKKIIKEAVKWS